MQNENALAAQDEASFISSENVDVDYIDEASATSSCQKRVMAPVDVKEESQKKRAKSAFDMKTYMRIRRQREKEMKEKQFVIDYLKKTSMLTMNTSGESPRLSNANPNQNPNELKHFVAILVTKGNDKVQKCIVWDVHYLDENSFSYGSKKSTGLVDYPLESFKGTVKIKMKNQLYNWLIVKKSNIEGAGFGLFAARDFNKGDIIGKYMGEVLDQKSDPSVLSKYAICSSKIAVDSKGGLNSGYPWYWGIHFVNDLNFVTRGIVNDSMKEKKQSNSIINDDFIMIAIKRIKQGQEIFLDYNFGTTI